MKAPTTSPLRAARRVATLFAAAVLAGTAAANPGQDYTLYCMGCHGATAQGVPGKIPPLAGALARFMRTSPGRDYVLRVPGAANSVLSDAQLAAVLNWLAERYRMQDDPRPEPFTAEEVAHSRHTPLADVQARRREVLRDFALTGNAPGSRY
ncbi:MAG: cytochrome c [Gammaproteobacteria bacterium]|nr:cytochrome c [Gammaproteobacteria bacterium]